MSNKQENYTVYKVLVFLLKSESKSERKKELQDLDMNSGDLTFLPINLLKIGKKGK